MNYSDVEYVQSCDWCKSERIKCVTSVLLPNYVKCLNCGLVFQNPRLPEDKVLHYLTMDEKGPEHKFEVWALSKRSLFKWALNILKTKKGRLLDIGCGYGLFLKLAEDEGWEVQGVEVSKKAATYCQNQLGLNVRQGRFTKGIFPAEYFDVVTLWDVLEDLTPPFIDLIEINRILKKNGVLLIRVRNLIFHLNILLMLGSICQILKIYPVIMKRYNFTPQVIKRILQKAGFKNIKVTNSKLTRQDPYETGRPLSTMGVELAKRLVYGMVQCLFYLSGKKLILGPSLLIWAEK